MSARWFAVACALVSLAVGGCNSLESHDNIYSRGADHFVMCGDNIDDKYDLGRDELLAALGRARLDGTTLHLYGHSPGETVRLETLEIVLRGAVERGLAFVTYADLLANTYPASLALSFDDHHLASWATIRPLLDRYGARVTFFVSLYTELSDEERAQLRQLADDGHDIEFHSLAHRDAEAYAAEHGVDAYVADDIVPALEPMRRDGYATRVFAYPFGARTEATDAALTEYFDLVRAIHTTCPW